MPSIGKKMARSPPAIPASNGARNSMVRASPSLPITANGHGGLELIGYGERTLLSASSSITHEGGKITSQRDENLTEWFINDNRGLEQGWTIHSRETERERGTGVPPVSSTLTLTLAVHGDLKSQVSPNSTSVAFQTSSGATALTYGGLKAWDADGTTLTVRFEPAGETAIRIAVEDQNARYPITIDPIAQQAYLKASNTQTGAVFGSSTAISGDTVVIGAPYESSNAIGVNGNQSNTSAPYSGAVYVFTRNGGTWTQEAYLKASNTGNGQFFGSDVSISGNTIVVGASGEKSNAIGVNGNQSSTSAPSSGAVYVFTRSSGIWTQQSYIKASNTGQDDQFGGSVSISGETMVVGAIQEDSNAIGVNGTQGDNSKLDSGAVYVFVRNGTTWTQQAYFKANYSVQGTNFGSDTGISGDTVVVGGIYENCFIFTRSGIIWTQQPYLSASNSGAWDFFGARVAISGNTIVVGANQEDSNATGVNGDGFNNDKSAAGAAYIFTGNGATWTQQAYLKASYTKVDAYFGDSVAISGDTVIVGSPGTIVVSPGTNSAAGAAYVFTRSGVTWSQQAFLQASNPESGDYFGGFNSVAIAGNTVVVGDFAEKSNATGVNGDQTNNGAPDSGAAYVFNVSGPAPTNLAGLTASDGATGDRFGWSVSQSGSIGLVGAYFDDIGANADQGSAYVFSSLDTATGAITQNAKLTAADGEDSDRFGFSVSQSGSIGLVGAYYDNIGANFDQGSAYVFRNLNTATGTATQNVKLTASDGLSGDQFGNSVSQSGSIGLVGANADAIGANSNQGSAYVFRNLDTLTGTITQNVKLTASDGAASDGLGYAVSLSGSIGLVGADLDDIGANSNQGSAYVFRSLDTATGTITENVKLTASDGAASDGLGWSVSQSGSIALAGAYGDDIRKGSAYVFRSLDTATGTITQSVKLTVSDGAAGDQFGYSVSQSGSIGLVGANGDNIGANGDQGSAYVFRSLDTATGAITQNVKLTASDGAALDNFGRSVGLDGDQFIIGASDKNSSTGKAYSGSVASVTTLDAGSTSKTISGISFISQDDWIVSQTTDSNQVTLSLGDTANVTASGKAVYIGKNAGSDNNRLFLSGILTATQVIVGTSTGNSGNTLEVTASGFLSVTNMTINSGSTLTNNGNITNSGTVRFLNGATYQGAGTFTNNGIFDIISGPQTLPSGFVNNGIVLDSSVVRVASAVKSGSDFILTIQGYAGHGYQLQRSDTLSGQWTSVGSVQNGNGLLLTFTDTGGASGAARFYRVLVSP